MRCACKAEHEVEIGCVSARYNEVRYNEVHLLVHKRCGCRGGSFVGGCRVMKCEVCIN